MYTTFISLDYNLHMDTTELKNITYMYIVMIYYRYMGLQFIFQFLRDIHWLTMLLICRLESGLYT